MVAHQCAEQEAGMVSIHGSRRARFQLSYPVGRIYGFAQYKTFYRQVMLVSGSSMPVADGVLIDRPDQNVIARSCCSLVVQLCEFHAKALWFPLRCDLASSIDVLIPPHARFA